MIVMLNAQPSVCVTLVHTMYKSCSTFNFVFEDMKQYLEVRWKETEIVEMISLESCSAEIGLQI